jgi:hypothetical protein
MAIFLLIVIALLAFKLGIATLIISALTALGQIIVFIVSVFFIGYLLQLVLGKKKTVHTLRKDQWRKL